MRATDKLLWTLTGSGSGRTLYHGTKRVAYLSQAGWRTSRRWHVYAPNATDLTLGSYLFCAATLNEAVSILTSQTVPTHESWHKWADPQPITEAQQAVIRNYFATL